MATNINGLRTRRKVLFLLNKFFIQNGYSPTYQQLADSLGVVKSHIFASAKILKAEGKVEICNSRLFPIGLRKKIMKLAKDEMVS